MLGDSSRLLATSTTPSTAAVAGGGGGGDAAAPAYQLPASGGGAQESSRSEVGHAGPSNNNSGEDDRRAGGGDEGDRSFGGNRWPRQETLALLKIRSDMDVAFRDASVKGPLWDEVSRKLAELGYDRSAKKCKEKFENVFKYHKRTKEGRSGKHEGKTYRFFDQLEAFETHTTTQSQQPPQSLPAPTAALPMPVVSPAAPPHHPSATAITVPSTTTATATNVSSQGIATIATNLAISNPTILPFSQATTTTNPTNLNQPQPNIQSNFSSHLASDSTSSSTSSDVEGRGRRKRKWGEFFERLMKEVIHKQEDMHKRFLEAIEKREHDRMVREEAWRMQEMARINREREILAQERSIAAAKDAAVMAFLQKLSEQKNPAAAQQQVQINPPPPPPQPVQPPPSSPITQTQPQPEVQPQPQAAPIAQALPVTVVVAAQPQAVVINLETKSDNGDQSLMPASSSRWPKIEVEALINLRTNLESKYQENGPKGPLWEEISAGMRKLGYNRNAKRCKEKWENINKYFKKVKESKKKRPEDSKTCPYFHQLDAIYKEKHKTEGITTSNPSSSSNIQVMKPDHHHHQINSVPLMVQPEQQWPPPPSSHHHHHHHHHHEQPQGHHHGSVMEDLESDDNQNDDPDDDDDKDMDDDEEDEASGYEIVANSNRPTSVSSAG